jgi:general secretion pathway protein H
MPTSAPGNSRGGSGRRRVGGFTLIELMMVITLVAVAAGAVSLALRDDRDTRLQREGERLATLLEAARAEARAAALPVRWLPTPDSNDHAFRFVGLPASVELPRQWLDDAVVAQIDDGRATVTLGPEPLIGAQRVQLLLDGERIAVGTDGLQPFAVQSAEPIATGTPP